MSRPQARRTVHMSRGGRGGARGQHGFGMVRRSCSLVSLIFFVLGATHHLVSGEAQGLATRNHVRRMANAEPACSKLRYDVQDKGTYQGSDFMRYLAVCEDTGEVLSIYQWAEIMARGEPSVTQSLTDTLKNVPYQAFFFETKGATSMNVHSKDFEFVVVDAPSLHSFASGAADPYTFADHLNCLPSDQIGCVFPNISGSATLVAPKRRNVPDDSRLYSHLASFVRKGEANQVADYWQLVGRAYLDRLDRTSLLSPVWLSTSGTGVAWLHFRLDQKPKYYQYQPFAVDE